jgi:predicted SnoaL-like aldol condensation-catalyzing enzyme
MADDRSVIEATGPRANGQLAEHWDVIQDEVSKADSLSGLPMFGDKFLD